MTQADVIVLAGGKARRLGGASKPEVHLHGVALLDHLLGGLDVDGVVVVVGPPELARTGVLVTREQPAFGGPVAGMVAGLAALSAETTPRDMVVVLACDMPDAGPLAKDLAMQCEHLGSVDAVYALSPDAQPQPLAAAYRTSALVRVLAELGSGHGVAAKRVLGAMNAHPLADRDYRSRDIDTWEDLEQATRQKGAPW